MCSKEKSNNFQLLTMKCILSIRMLCQPNHTKDNVHMIMFQLLVFLFIFGHFDQTKTKKKHTHKTEKCQKKRQQPIHECENERREPFTFWFLL